MSSQSTLIVAGTAALLLFWMLGAHNRVTALRNAIHHAWPPVDALLAQRSELLQPVLDLLRERLPSEHSSLEAVAAALLQVKACAEAVRSRPSRHDPVAGLAVAEAALGPTLTRLKALVDNDSALRGEVALTQALAALDDLDRRLSFARQAFNDCGRSYNAAVLQFPTNLLAPALRFGRAGQF